MCRGGRTVCPCSPWAICVHTRSPSGAGIPNLGTGRRWPSSFERHTTRRSSIPCVDSSRDRIRKPAVTLHALSAVGPFFGVGSDGNRGAEEAPWPRRVRERASWLVGLSSGCPGSSELREAQERGSEDDVEIAGVAPQVAHLCRHAHRCPSHAPLPLPRREGQKRPVGVDTRGEAVQDRPVRPSVVGLERENAKPEGHVRYPTVLEGRVSGDR
jgi:hypothetical protein